MLAAVFLFCCSMPAEKVRIIEVKEEVQKELPESGTESQNGSETEVPVQQEQPEQTEQTEQTAQSEQTGEPEQSEQSEQTGESETEPETTPETDPASETEQEPESEPEPEPLPELDPMPEIPEPAKLTLVVYMAADNDLESYAIANLKAMEHADFKNLNVLVLLDRADGFDETNGNWTDTRLFELEHDDTDGNLIVSKRLSCPILGLSNKVETELDMGNPSVLWNLLNFARNNYESEKYALIIWGHGTGWRYYPITDGLQDGRAVAIDDRTGSYMSVHSLGRALRNQGLSVIGFDTCFGGVFENVYELKNYADYTVASPGITPSGGWDYQQLLEDFSDSDFYSRSIAEIMADASSAKATVFNNVKLTTLMTDFEAFSKALADSIRTSTDRTAVYNKLLGIKSYCYSQYPSDMYLDIYYMAAAYKTSSDSTVSSAAKKLIKTINNSAVTTDSANAEIGIHFIPKTGPNTTAYMHSADYVKDSDNSDQCQFVKESQWWVPTKGGVSGSLLDKLFYDTL